MPEELLLVEATRRPTARELRWIHLKFERTRNVLRARARLSIGCLCLVIPVLSLILKLYGMGFWAWVLAIACVFSVMSLSGNWRARRKIGRMGNLVENGMVQETRVVSNRCFELWVGEGGEDGSFLHFFDLGERGLVMTRLRNGTSDPLSRKLHLFDFPVRDRDKEMAITAFRFSITRRFPNSNFVVSSFVVDEKVLSRWLRCPGRMLEPVRSIFFGSHSEVYEGPGYEPMVMIQKPFDDCLLQVLERR